MSEFIYEDKGCMLSLTCVPSSKSLDVSIQPEVTAETRKTQRNWGGGSREGQKDIGDMI